MPKNHSRSEVHLCCLAFVFHNFLFFTVSIILKTFTITVKAKRVSEVIHCVSQLTVVIHSDQKLIQPIRKVTTNGLKVV
jgi:hypothetical protein